jgi:predicted nuclease of predicted toxin-antitoxin system
MAKSQLGFFLDEDLPPAIAEMLRSKGITATSVVAEKRQGLSDEDQLRFAATHNLTLVTANVADYLELARQWTARGQNHAGIVFVLTKRFPRRSAVVIVRALQAFVSRETGEQMANSARFLTTD